MFSADGFGKFGALDAEEAWTCEARRYYFNIVGKYGIAVQALLAKVKELKIQMICPAHGVILTQPLEEYIKLLEKDILIVLLLVTQVNDAIYLLSLFAISSMMENNLFQEHQLIQIIAIC